MLDCLYKVNEVPYGTLEQFGLTQEMVEDLPEDILQEILNGFRSPLLPVVMKDDRGNTVKARARFLLFRNDDDDLDILFYPRMLRCELGDYTEEEQAQLHEGKVIISHAPDDADLKCFVQIDPDTNQVIYVPTPVIGRNLASMVNHFRLSTDDIRLIQQGEVVTFMVGDEPVTAGIDLRNRTGLRLVSGTERDWKAEVQSGPLERFNFGIYGCWVKGDDGTLDYVHESDYTEEILDAMEQEVQRKGGLKR